MTDELVHGVDFKLLRPFRAFGLSSGTSDRVFVELADPAIMLVELFLAVCDFVLQGLHDVADVPLRLPETFFDEGAGISYQLSGHSVDVVKHKTLGNVFAGHICQVSGRLLNVGAGRTLGLEDGPSLGRREVVEAGRSPGSSAATLLRK